ncbi:MAG: hypothetical protein Q9169_004513 [Polycauliona sp. 2 TL-2023]
MPRSRGQSQGHGQLRHPFVEAASTPGHPLHRLCQEEGVQPDEAEVYLLHQLRPPHRHGRARYYKEIQTYVLDEIDEDIYGPEENIMMHGRRAPEGVHLGGGGRPGPGGHRAAHGGRGGAGRPPRRPEGPGFAPGLDFDDEGLDDMEDMGMGPMAHIGLPGAGGPMGAMGNMGGMGPRGGMGPMGGMGPRGGMEDMDDMGGMFPMAIVGFPGAGGPRGGMGPMGGMGGGRPGRRPRRGGQESEW